MGAEGVDTEGLVEKGTGEVILVVNEEDEEGETFFMILEGVGRED